MLFVIDLVVVLVVGWLLHFLLLLLLLLLFLIFPSQHVVNIFMVGLLNRSNLLHTSFWSTFCFLSFF